MTRYKIVYNKNDCIGVAACVSMAEKWWKMDGDDKAILNGSTLNQETGFYELEIGENELEDAKSSVNVCPVFVIMVHKQEDSGEWVKIAPED